MEHAGPRSHRTLPPGSLGAPAIPAGIRCVLQEIAPRREDLERCTFPRTAQRHSASYDFRGFPKSPRSSLYIFQYALNAPLGEDLHGPLTEFLSDGISLLETSLLEISDTGQETSKTRHFQRPLSLRVSARAAAVEPQHAPGAADDARIAFLRNEPEKHCMSARPVLISTHCPRDDEVPDEILEFLPTRNRRAPADRRRLPALDRAE